MIVWHAENLQMDNALSTLLYRTEPLVEHNLIFPQAFVLIVQAQSMSWHGK